MIRPGRAWGEPAPAGPEVEVTGGDADLAAAVVAHPGAVVRFAPDPTSDLARALGLTTAGTGRTVVACDALEVRGTGAPAPATRLAVNAVVLGVAPDRLRPWHRSHPVRVEVDGRPVGEGRATTVVVATGQFLRGADLVPRGHPGDGRVEIQVYAVPAGERPALRGRLPTGEHVPHPRIATASGRAVTVTWAGRRLGSAAPVELDGRAAGRARHLEIAVVPGAVRVRC